MSAGTLNFNGQNGSADACEQGADFVSRFYWEDANGSRISLSDYSMKMQVRNNYQKTLIVEFSTENSRITIDSNEEATLALTAAETTLLPPGKYICDMKITHNTSGFVTRLFKGDFVVTPEVTV